MLESFVELTLLQMNFDKQNTKMTSWAGIVPGWDVIFVQECTAPQIVLKGNFMTINDQPPSWRLPVWFLYYYILTALSWGLACAMGVIISGPGVISFMWEALQPPYDLKPSTIFGWVIWMVLPALAGLLATIRNNYSQEGSRVGVKSLKVYAVFFGVMLGILTVMTPEVLS